VISATVDRYAYVSLKPREDREICVKSLDYDLVAIFRTISDLKYNGELDLVKATLKTFGINDIGLDMTLFCDAPPGSGLGSSSSVMVAMIGVFKELLGRHLSSYEIADLAYKIERMELGIKGGLQDQYAAAFGGFNFIEFDAKSVVVNPLRVRPEILDELLASLLLVNTGKTRLSAKILERQIRATEEKEEIVLESLDSLKQLAVEMKNSLLKGDLTYFGGLLGTEWEYKKRLDKAITTPFIEKLYDAACKKGALGGKICGAGAGGHLLLFCDFERKCEVAKEVMKLGCETVKFNFDFGGLRTWRVRNRRVQI